MTALTDPAYLKNDQYRDDSNLRARMRLHERFSANPRPWFDWLFDTLDELPSSARVLELGCGTGQLWKTCAQRIPPGWSITLSDFSPGMVDAAWRNLIVLGRGFKFEEIDAQSIPYPGDSFDIVIANHMLYHVPDRPRALAEIRRVLKPAGCLVASTIGEDSLREMLPWLERIGAEMDFRAANNPFTLQNGASQLQPFFSRVEMRRQVDSLRITELAPLLDYLRSARRAQPVPAGVFETLAQELQEQLARDGEIIVSKDNGLFIAVK